MSDQLLAIFTVCGTATSLLLLLAPLPAYIKAGRTESTAGLSFEYIMASNVSQVAWSLYGMKEGAIAILYPSVVGVVVTFAYLLVHKAIQGPVLNFLIIYFTAGLAGTAVIYRSLEVSGLGLVCLLFSTANSISALFPSLRAYQQRNPTLIDLNISLCLFLCGLCWTGYGFLTQDIFILLPNIMCQLVALINIAMKEMMDETWTVKSCWWEIRGIWKESRLHKQTAGYFWV